MNRLEFEELELRVALVDYNVVNLTL